MSDHKNIFVIGLDAHNLRKLRSLQGASHYAFHDLLGYRQVKRRQDYPIEALVRSAEETLDQFPGPIDAIIGYWDFPVSLMVPLLANRRGLRAPSLEATLMCEHKYLSRLKQREVIAEHTPRFDVVNPFKERTDQKPALPYPFWMKPVKSFRSYLGFRVANDQEFDHSLELTRQSINRFGEPFNFFLNQVELPEEVGGVDGHCCVAEEIVSGKQCTVCGYALDGEAYVYGLVDSIRESDKTSFSRYQYPSKLPESFQGRLAEVTKKVIAHIGLHNSAFNIEFVYHEDDERFFLLEINPRISESHCDLYEKVDGVSDQQITVDLALGRQPAFPHREGQFAYAAKFFLRAYENAFVKRVPTEAEILDLERDIPGLLVKLQVHEGMRLSELLDQDSYSFELADVFIGGRSEQDLLEKFEQAAKALPFEFSH